MACSKNRQSFGRYSACDPTHAHASAIVRSETRSAAQPQADVSGTRSIVAGRREAAHVACCLSSVACCVVSDAGDILGRTDGLE